MADVVERHAREVRELRRALFVLKRLLTAHEAGQVLGGVGAATVMEYVREKGLPCYRPGKAPLFLLDDLVAWAVRHPEGGGLEQFAREAEGLMPLGPPVEPHGEPAARGERAGARGAPGNRGAPGRRGATRPSTGRATG